MKKATFKLKSRKLHISVGAAVLGVLLIFCYSVTTLEAKPKEEDNISLTPIEELGKRVFFDNISDPKRMSCSTCHEPRTGGTSAISGINQHDVVMPGADPHTFGNRRPPSNTYASFSPAFVLDLPGPVGAIGGNFWDGRSVGFEGEVQSGSTQVIDPSIFLPGYDYSEYLGPTADQALNPFPNHVEQNISQQEVCQHVESSKYMELFEEVFGEPIDCGDSLYEVNYQRIAVALAAWQASSDVNSFSSLLDKAIEDFKNSVPPSEPLPAAPVFPLPLLSEQENRGHDLFYVHCARFCHNDGNAFGPDGNRTDWNELYTSHEYFNIGTPANLEIPGYETSDPDIGLMAHTGLDEHKGQHKTPTMRNVDKRPGNGFTKAYAHNGWFKSLESIVHFYNTRDVKNGCPEEITSEKDALKNDCWPAPEVAENVFAGGPIGMRVGAMGLSDEQEEAIVAYLKTLSDGHTAKEPKPYKK